MCFIAFCVDQLTRLASPYFITLSLAKYFFMFVDWTNIKYFEKADAIVV